MFTRSGRISAITVFLCLSSASLWAGQTDLPSGLTRMDIRTWMPALAIGSDSWVPTFRMHSTSSSYPGPIPKSQEDTILQFASSNLDNLVQDIATGGGEHLASLAVLMGLSKNQHPGFFTCAQAKYEDLAGALTGAELVHMLKTDVVAAHQEPSLTR
ncbi:MAG: DUF3015 family protein [Nitrospirae bacterium]|nr:DUF3015 family protein [Nitrospirota bacterium]